MAKKSTKTATAAAVAQISNVGQIIEIPLSLIDIDPEVSARASDPDPETIEELAESFIERRTQGKQYQIVPGIVLARDERYVIYEGRHRFEACKAAQEVTGEAFPLIAYVGAAKDGIEALMEGAAANEWRQAPNDFDRANVIKKLYAAGKNREEIASVLHVSKSSITAIEKVADLEPKYKKALADGEMERDAVLFIASMTSDDETKRNEVFEEARRHKTKMLQFQADYETKQARKEAEAKIANAKEALDEHKGSVDLLTDQIKERQKIVKDLDSAASKTKGEEAVAQLLEIKEKQDAEKKEIAALEAERTAKQKAFDEAKAALEAAKKAKDEIKAKKAADAKVTVEDVKAVAAAAGSKDKRVQGPIKLNRQQFINEINALAKDDKNPLSEPVKSLLGKIEEFIDGDIKAPGFRNALMFFVRDEDEIARAKSKRKK